MLLNLFVLSLSILLSMGEVSTEGECKLSEASIPKTKPTFPPTEISRTASGAEIAKWFKDNIPSPKGPPPMTDREKLLARLTAIEFIAMRRIENVTCEEYAAVLIKRAKHYAYMNHFMYWDVMPNQMEVVMDMAKALDKKAAKEGISAIAPLNCLPVPLKGTMASIDFPSSAGSGVLHNLYAVKNAAAAELLIEKNGIPFAKSNVPEFAASYVTCNYANGCTLNAYDHALTAGGSSGGSGSIVASYIAPIAFTEDTGGSTRHPATQNQNFGYDPSRNHYPNDGNPGMSYTNDQVGINARTMDDILAFDAAYLATFREHQHAFENRPYKTKIKVGIPKYPFAEFFMPKKASNIFNYPTEESKKMHVSSQNMKKYNLAVKTLKSAGVKVLDKEWPEDKNGLNKMANLFVRTINGKPFDQFLAVFHSFQGQIATYVTSYLNASVSMKEIIEDVHSAGDGHNPAKFMRTPDTSDESQFRYALGTYQDEYIDAWNSYFDEYGVDVIMTPSQYCDALTFECQADSTCTIGSADGDKANSPLVHCNCMSYSVTKMIPVPKVTVPVGLNADGHPVSITFWGRSGPKNADDRLWRYEDSWAKTGDVEFLHIVAALVKELEETQELKRVDAPLVIGEDNLFDKSA